MHKLILHYSEAIVNKIIEEETKMSRSNQTLIPQAKAGLDKFKIEVASEIGMRDYAAADKGNLTSRQNGSVGGEMVKRMVADYESKIK